MLRIECTVFIYTGCSSCSKGQTLAAVGFHILSLLRYVFLLNTSLPLCNFFSSRGCRRNVLMWSRRELCCIFFPNPYKNTSTICAFLLTQTEDEKTFLISPRDGFDFSRKWSISWGTFIELSLVWIFSEVLFSKLIFWQITQKILKINVHFQILQKAFWCWELYGDVKL